MPTHGMFLQSFTKRLLVEFIPKINNQATLIYERGSDLRRELDEGTRLDPSELAESREDKVTSLRH